VKEKMCMADGARVWGALLSSEPWQGTWQGNMVNMAEKMVEAEKVW
jgi:hypothetical protein